MLLCLQAWLKLFLRLFDVLLFAGVMQTVPVEFNTNSQVDETDYDASLGVKDARSYNEFIVNGHMDEFKYYYRVLSDTGERSFYIQIGR